MCPATIALACSLGPIVYLLAGFLTSIAAAKMFRWKFTRTDDVISIGLSVFVWPLILWVLLFGVLGFGLGKLVGRVVDD